MLNCIWHMNSLDLQSEQNWCCVVNHVLQQQPGNSHFSEINSKVITFPFHLNLFLKLVLFPIKPSALSACPSARENRVCCWTTSQDFNSSIIKLLTINLTSFFHFWKTKNSHCVTICRLDQARWSNKRNDEIDPKNSWGMSATPKPQDGCYYSFNFSFRVILTKECRNFW